MICVRICYFSLKQLILIRFNAIRSIPRFVKISLLIRSGRRGRMDSALARKSSDPCSNPETVKGFRMWSSEKKWPTLHPVIGRQSCWVCTNKKKNRSKPSFIKFLTFVKLLLNQNIDICRFLCKSYFLV